MSRSFSRDYALLLAAAFAWGSSTSQLAMLAVVLRDRGMSASNIAIVLSAVFAAMVPATLMSGTLSARYGARRTMIGAVLISCAVLAMLPFTLASVPAATTVMAARGLANGLFTPAGQAFAQAQAVEGDRSRAVGMFTAMFLIPTFYSPAVGQLSLAHLGEPGFFALAGLPTVVALAATCSLRRTEEVTVSHASGYLALLRDRRQWLPILATMQSGLAYAFAFSFLPLLLTERGLAVATFFTPFAVVLLAVRFIGLKYLQRQRPATVTAIGLLAYAGGLSCLTAPGWLAASFGGVLFAFGYGVILPTCVAWSTSHYPQAERARSVALVNTSFNLGSILAVQATGAALSVLGWSGLLMMLAAAVATVALVIAMPKARSAPERLPQSSAATRKSHGHSTNRPKRSGGLS